MPEYPDITVYIERLRHFIQGEPLQQVRLANPFLLRTVEPPLAAIEGAILEDIERLGKRICLGFAGEYYLVLHLMISGRLRWQKSGSAVPRRIGLAALDFPPGTLLITEASTQKRASLHLVRGREQLAQFARGGLELFEASLQAFAAALRAENHTLKRSLTDPRIISGVGNAYSDEILHRARLSPVIWTSRLTDEEIARLFDAARAVLHEWTDRLRAEVGDGFPHQVTAFHAAMAVHGKYGQPCPVCGGPVQRIRYASRETNYCPGCQTEGKLRADRALSRLLGRDWPRTLEELEAHKASRRTED